MNKTLKYIIIIVIIYFLLKKNKKEGFINVLTNNFIVKKIAVTNKKIKNLPYHSNPDGGAIFKYDGGWIYVSNSESGNNQGGVGAIKFNNQGTIIDYYKILSNSNVNCAGGKTPNNIWLSCEEHRNGIVWGCDPFGIEKPKKLLKMGVFSHEAAAVDPNTNIVYLTEDDTDGLIYRFISDNYNYTEGTLQAACKGNRNKIIWKDINDPLATSIPTKYQVDNGLKNNKWEGCIYHPDGYIFIVESRKGIYRYDIQNENIELFYESNNFDVTKLNSPDNICLTPNNNLLVSEDPGHKSYLELWVININTKDSYPLIKVTDHKGSELTGMAFSPDNSRLYFSSQRGTNGNGIIYEIKGDFSEI